MGDEKETVQEIPQEEFEAAGAKRLRSLEGLFEEKRWFKYGPLLGVVHYCLADNDWLWVILVRGAGTYVVAGLGVSLPTEKEAVRRMREKMLAHTTMTTKSLPRTAIAVPELVLYMLCRLFVQHVGAMKGLGADPVMAKIEENTGFSPVQITSMVGDLMRRLLDGDLTAIVVMKDAFPARAD